MSLTPLLRNVNGVHVSIISSSLLRGGLVRLVGLSFSKDCSELYCTLICPLDLDVLSVYVDCKTKFNNLESGE